jgi:hypothetical protein
MWHDDWPGEAGWELVPPEDHPDAVLATDSYVGRLREKALRELFGSFNIDIGELG